MALNSDIIRLDLVTASQIAAQIASNIKQRRLELNFTQMGLSARAGVNIETYRRFERTGQISLQALAKIAIALDAADELTGLFTSRKYKNLDELMEAQTHERKRGKRNE